MSVTNDARRAHRDEIRRGHLSAYHVRHPLGGQPPRQWNTLAKAPAGYSQAYQLIYQTYLKAFHHMPLVAAVSQFGQESKQTLKGGPDTSAVRAAGLC